jgi:hypothetical protein
MLFVSEEMKSSDENRKKTLPNQHMIILTDSFNSVTISRHRTVDAAVRAQRAHARAVARRNGRGSYIPTSITSSSGEDIRDSVDEARVTALFPH